MIRFVTYAVAVLIALSSTVAVAQKVTSVEELDKTMKRVGQANMGVNKALQSMAYADARKQLTGLRQALVDADAFWVSHKADAAVKFSKGTVSKIDALDKLLAAPTPDNSAVMAAFKDLGCRDCHMGFREQVGEEYRIKAGSIAGL